MHKTLAFLLLLLPGLALGQGRLSGVVQDSATHQALAFSSVFLANTTLGATTDEQGRFEFPKVPAGSYDVVGSYVGYRLSKQSITIGKGAAPQQVTLLLASSGPQLGEVVVEANPHRAEDFKKFSDFFLGESTFSQQCHITNPKDIVVYTNDSTKELTAAAKNFVQVENEALGYRLKYFGMFFTYNPETDFTAFSGQPVFEEMTPRDAAQQRQWEANRATAYVGSFPHFVRSVYAGQLRANGFLAQQVRLTPNPRFQRLEPLLRRPAGSLTDAEQDSLAVLGKLDPAFATLYPAARPLDSLRRVASDGRVFLRFTGELQVAHFGEAPDANYTTPMATLGPEPRKQPYPAKREVSRLRLQTREAEIRPNGALRNPADISTGEYWGFEKMGEFLPLDYQPPALAPAPAK
ncbi:carboxypeptidase-like regulatory domain-containing protein [Hymenobacter cheonanensis]|uniref:carboxypeptidase-like regulatory domain-containing protein n=1 Tax=Hymenobacter sp. CA2-7 TaxID=3063993 RepID=UPI0027129B15|nr:carboxypeptidase-like regulatory domain-containing protein [Hymenobacter sp. CA2-7]MDO7887357.1 carboxypeptidase-like regulatory domain-containing protein [Hymenobacter sp. CA2-7]